MNSYPLVKYFCFSFNYVIVVWENLRHHQLLHVTLGLILYSLQTHVNTVLYTHSYWKG